jgi:hypothetical protein
LRRLYAASMHEDNVFHRKSPSFQKQRRIYRELTKDAIKGLFIALKNAT